MKKTEETTNYPRTSDASLKRQKYEGKPVSREDVERDLGLVSSEAPAVTAATADHDRACLWIDEMADLGVIGHYREAKAKGRLADLLAEVRADERSRRTDDATPKNEPQRRKLVPDATLEAKLRVAIEDKDWPKVDEVRDALDDRSWYVAEERVETADRIWKWLDQNGYPEAAKASFDVRELFFYPETEDTDGRLAARSNKDRLTNRQIAERLDDMVKNAEAWLPRHVNALVRMLDENRVDKATVDGEKPR